MLVDISCVGVAPSFIFFREQGKGVIQAIAETGSPVISGSLIELDSSPVATIPVSSYHILYVINLTNN